MSLAGLWGVLGTVWMLVDAVRRLSLHAIWPFQEGETRPLYWLAYLAFAVGMAYAEGYRGFHKAFAPRVVARGYWLAGPAPLHLKLLAPLFCMGLLHATRRRLIANWCLVIGVVTLAVGVSQLSHAVRAVVDAGVVVGLSVGTASILWWWVRQRGGEPCPVPLDLPTGPQPQVSS